MHSPEWPLNTKPFKVQLEAIRAAGGRRRFAYFMEMGMGKTQTTLAEFVRAHNKGFCDTLMVICPTPLMSVWEREIKKVGIDIPIVQKPKSRYGLPNPCVVIYNIESVNFAAGDTIPLICNTRNVFLALDESITIKNFKSKRWKKIKKWGRDPKVIRILSGYPQVQDPTDYWSQLWLVGAPVHKSPYAFKNTFCVMGGWENKQVVGIRNEEKLAQMIADVSFQAKKKDWLDLPEKIYTTIDYQLNKEQAFAYYTMREALYADIKGEIITVEQAMHRSMKLQQVGSGFMIDESGNPRTLVHYTKNPKFHALKSVMESINGKAIVFAQFRETCDQLIEMLDAPFIRGGMSDDEINCNVDIFNNTINCPAIVCQLASAQYGFTLLGNDTQPCHTTIYFENSYNLNNRVQSEDRNHRIGQHFPVTYVDFMGTDVERRVVERLQQKKRLAEIIDELAAEARKK